MTLLPINMLIALAWIGVSGDASFTSVVLGMVAGFIALYPFAGFGTAGYHRRVISGMELALYFAWDLTRSSVQVAMAVLAPDTAGPPRFVTMSLDAKTDLGITLTANLISLTPGTLSVDVADDRRSLLIHAMFGDDPDQTAADLKHGIERRVIRVVE